MSDNKDFINNIKMMQEQNNKRQIAGSSKSTTEQAAIDIQEKDKIEQEIVDMTQGNATVTEEFLSRVHNKLPEESGYSNYTSYSPYFNDKTITPINGVYLNRELAIQANRRKYKYPYDTNYERFTAHYMNNVILRSANPPKEAMNHIPSSYRYGNNSDVNYDKIIYQNNNKINTGPYNIHIHKCD